ncbi:hypothetical protein PQO03_05810 [Lentisphaera profundi]|uniref:Heparinase II N-terminal domain-containing protein n=1 Tax=Lentisphaera profundi TaxID=1658616 RepID=A0ABY7VMK1_9BACT|nr:hypothetical protein [Lentisphaera profundi]WDE95235.1 hypothetical protein PQO03_05810 [Lentisphaera profundi]
MKKTLLKVSFIFSLFSSLILNAAEPMAQLPGEQTADQILKGEYMWPNSPKVDLSKVDDKNFDPYAFGEVPASGIHPRILISPDDLPRIRAGIKNTLAGAYAYHQITVNQKESIRNKGSESYELLKALAAGDEDLAMKIMKKESKFPRKQKYSHRYGFAYVLMTEALDSLIREDEKMGKELAAAISTLSTIYYKRLVAMDESFKAGKVSTDKYNTPDRFHGFRLNEQSIQLNGDVWRSNRRAAIDGEPWFAFMYDYAHHWMNEEQRANCRKALNKYHFGKTTMGSHMPHHFRNWNWIAIGSGGLYLTALATEGEPGNDQRVIDHAREILTDFVKYGWSDMGSSDEAIGYSQFGLRWAIPGFIAMARRGDNIWNLNRWKNSVNWYAQSSQPNAFGKGNDSGQRFISHGDGGQGGPSTMTMQAFKRFYPNDPVVDYVLQRTNQVTLDKNGNFPPPNKKTFYNSYPHMDLIIAADSSKKQYNDGKNLGLKNTFFDPDRNSLITRDKWGIDQLQLQFEARDDGHAPNHQHADKGAFTLTGAGRVWADERFRSVEGRHHSLVIIDGKGQGYFTPPSTWLGMQDNEDVTIAAVDTAYSHAWRWPGELCGYVDLNDPRRKFARYANFTEKADAFLAKNLDFKWQDHVDRHPKLEKFYKGFEKGDPRIWDEYSRPLRIEHNPVEKAFRSAMLVRGEHPYVLITDDIKKDDQERLYEWLMMLTPNTEVASIGTHEIMLFDESHPNMEMKPGLNRKIGAKVPMCLVSVLDRTIPEDIYTNPQIRLETFELKDARSWPQGRGFQLQKRLVIPSRAVEPNFKVLLYPHYKGAKLPKYEWNESRNQVTVTIGKQVDVITFTMQNNGRNKISISRNNKKLAEL